MSSTRRGDHARHAAPGDDALITTKLFVPPARPDVVVRSRMDERLSAGLRRKLMLISAPAGFGKTTILTAWRARQSGHDWPFAWVSLDAGDNDPVRFWTYVSMAFASAQPDAGHPALALLRAPHPPPLEAVLTRLLNQLASTPRDVVLVLDDYHVIEAAAIHQTLGFFLDHQPPQVHVVIATRADPPLPLAQLRARGDLAELRATDLRFTVAEARRFLTEAQALPLADHDVTALATRTEGWIAGLQLAALSLQGHEDPAGFITAFAGSHRFLVDYLAEEVLTRQAPDMQAFLLGTAILDRMSGPLCDAVTGRCDGQAMLERLEQANLFTIPLDFHRQWYRYHHLFAEFLRARRASMAPELVAELHRRAATWLEREGFVHDAVRHALAGMDVEQAARLVEQAAEPMWGRGELITLLQWLEALPRPVVRARPRLALTHAAAHFLARSYDANGVTRLIGEAEAALGSEPRRDNHAVGMDSPEERTELQGVLAAIRAAAATTREDPLPAIASAQVALDALPKERTFWRTAATVSLGLGYDANGETVAASRALTQAVDLSRQSGNHYLTLVATVNLARVRAAEGHLHAAARLCHQGLALATEMGDSQGRLPVATYCHVQLGRLLYEWDALEDANQHLMEGVTRAVQADQQLRARIDGYAALSRVRYAQGDLDGADEMLQRCEQAAQTSQLPWPTSVASAYRANFDVQRGNLAAAIRWAEEAGLRADDQPTYSQEFAYLTLARILIAQCEQDSAIALLDWIRSEAVTAGRTSSVIETLKLQATARQAQGQGAAAHSVLESALSLAVPERYVRLFVDDAASLKTLLMQLRAKYRNPAADPRTRELLPYVNRLLTALVSGGKSGEPAHTSSASTSPSPPIPEQLTPREREVLGLIADGLSNPEIADQLFVAVGTVKTYINTIFSKLGVVSRTQAVARARALGLLVDEAPRQD